MTTSDFLIAKRQEKLSPGFGQYFQSENEVERIKLVAKKDIRNAISHFLHRQKRNQFKPKWTGKTGDSPTIEHFENAGNEH
jgi:hypothetical protein